jgi:steroid delta-isomerase-like uncharacterized protein
MSEASFELTPEFFLEANKQLVRRWFEEVWNQQSEAAIDAMFSPDGKSHGFPEPDSVLVGPDAFKTVHRTFCGAFPDQKIIIDDIIAEGDHVAIRWRVTMTHSGDHLGFPASNKKTSMAGSSFIIIKGNFIIEGWNQMDLGNLFRELQAP